ncbi:MAG: dephospho-CoA kinase [Cyanobacteria bacterium J06638_22]
MGNISSDNQQLSDPASDTTSPPVQQRTIGLTGGIGMGKTTVSNYLANMHHLPVLDADLYARDAVTNGSKILAEIEDRYGPSILLPSGQLNRARLGEIVFTCRTEMLWLEKQIHPYVRDRMTVELKTIDRTQHPVLVLVVPLLFEARMTDLVSEVWVVYCSRPRQIARLQQRDAHGQMNLAQIQARIDSQMAIAEKLRRADIILENNTTPEALYQQIDHAVHPFHGDRQ